MILLKCIRDCIIPLLNLYPSNNTVSWLSKCQIPCDHLRGRWTQPSNFLYDLIHNSTQLIHSSHLIAFLSPVTTCMLLPPGLCNVIPSVWNVSPDIHMANLHSFKSLFDMTFLARTRTTTLFKITNPSSPVFPISLFLFLPYLNTNHLLTDDNIY